MQNQKGMNPSIPMHEYIQQKNSYSFYLQVYYTYPPPSEQALLNFLIPDSVDGAFVSSSTLPQTFDRRSATIRLVKLALPLYGTQLAQMGISTCAIILAGRSGTVDLAAVSLSGNLWLPIFILLNGTLMGLTPVIAHLKGAGRVNEFREQIHQSIWIALLLGVVTSLVLVFLTPFVLAAMHVAPNVQQSAHTYLCIAACGIPALALFQTLRSCAEGMNNTRVALFCTILSLLLSIPLGVCLVFGYFGFPPMGAKGCGITTAFAMWADLLLILFYFHRSPTFRALHLWKHGIHRPHWPIIKNLLGLGLPIGISIFSEVMMFATMALLIATFGTVAIAAHEVAVNISGILYMGPLSLGMALTIRVGTRMGEGSSFLARKEALNGLRLAVLFALFNDVIVFVFGHWLATLYSDQANVIALSVTLLHFALVFQLSDALQSTLGGILRGYKDTRAAMIITLFAYWIVGFGAGIPLGYGIPGLWHGFGIYGFWCGMIISLTASALLLYIRSRRTAKRRLSVTPPQ